MGKRVLVVGGMMPLSGMQAIINLLEAIQNSDLKKVIAIDSVQGHVMQTFPGTLSSNAIIKY